MIWPKGVRVLHSGLPPARCFMHDELISFTLDPIDARLVPFGNSSTVCFVHYVVMYIMYVYTTYILKAGPLNAREGSMVEKLVKLVETNRAMLIIRSLL